MASTINPDLITFQPCDGEESDAHARMVCYAGQPLWCHHFRSPDDPDEVNLFRRGAAASIEARVARMSNHERLAWETAVLRAKLLAGRDSPPAGPTSEVIDELRERARDRSKKS